MAECLQDLLQCPICLERFTQPKMLPCQHTFCLSCLRGIAKDDKTLACPQCRVEHQLPKGGVRGLPDNILANNFLSMFGENVTITTSPKAECFDCHRKTILNECQHCKESVCGDCRASHAKLLEEIQRLLKVGENDARENYGWEAESLDNLLKEIGEKEAEIPEKFNELREDIQEKVAQRERDLTQFLKILEKRVTVALSGGKKDLTEVMQDELNCCKTKFTLETFSNMVDKTEKGISAYLETRQGRMDISYRGFELNDIGSVTFNDYNVEVGQSSAKTRRKADNFNQMKAWNLLPKNVNYKEKDFHVIDKHGDSSIRLVPDYAVYSERLDTIFCVTEGQVLIYGSGGAEAPSVLYVHDKPCTHIAVTESGKLLVAESATVHMFDLLERRTISNGSSMLKREMKLDSVKSVDQICCYGEEFAVFTSNEKKMLIFSEEGQIIREFKVGNINSGSRLTVDQEGVIYLVSVFITEKTETGAAKGCPNHAAYRKVSQLRVTMSTTVYIYSWTGNFLKKHRLNNLTRTLNYNFDDWCGGCGQLHARNNNSLPKDDQILNDHRIRGLCVDRDGFLSIAMNNQIQVYSQKPKPLADEGISNEKSQLEVAEEAEDNTEKLDVVTSVGRHMTPGGGFGGELGGVSLMPDGRMIVCEKGSNRIVIL